MILFIQVCNIVVLRRYFPSRFRINNTVTNRQSPNMGSQPNKQLRAEAKRLATEAKARSDRIDKLLAADSAKNEYCIKILMLGPGGAGKSTVVKQMRLMRLNGFSHEELLKLTETIRLELVKELLVVARNFVTDGGVFSSHYQDYFHVIQSYYANYQQTKTFEFPSELEAPIKLLANHGGIQRFLQNYRLICAGSAAYYLQRAASICSPSYAPTQDDVLNMRVPTTGAHEISFTEQKLTFRVVDVGGQKSERRKWIYQFDNIDALMFLAALGDFNIYAEDSKLNGMTDALDLFQFICVSHWFGRSSLILFLNKKDIFKEKLNAFFLKDHVPEFEGANEYKTGIVWFKTRFARISGEVRPLYCHVTRATDSNQMKHVIQNCLDTIVDENLKKSDMA